MAHATCLGEVVHAVRHPPAGHTVWLIVAFDGVLLRYVEDPRHARLTPSARAALRAVALGSGVAVTIVSGRPADDLRARVAVDAPLYYGGLHGLEVLGPRGTLIHPRCGEVRGLLAMFARALRQLTAALPGVVVEDKGDALALHARAAREEDAIAARAFLMKMAADLVSAGVVRLICGDRITEVLPNVPWTWSDALKWVERDIARPLWRVCVVSDLDDAELFRSAGPDGLTVAVGRRNRRARYHVHDPDDVMRLLEGLAHGVAC
jgi:trehalose 6-phosphate phosphatase